MLKWCLFAAQKLYVCSVEFKTIHEGGLSSALLLPCSNVVTAGWPCWY